MKAFVRIPFYLLMSLFSTLIGCNEKKESSIAYDVDMEKYERKAVSEDSLTTVYQKTLFNINQDLAFISGKAGAVSKASASPLEQGISIKERISRNIMIINVLVDANKSQIAFLTSEVKKHKSGNAELYQALKVNRKKLSEYEVQLDSYKEELIVKNYTEDELNTIIDDLILESELLRIQADKYRTDLSTGYYVCEDRNELKKQGVLVEKGGVLGIGRTAILNAEATNENNFTQIDIHKIRDIAIHGEKPELVTSHPEGTYEFQRKNNMVTYLHIEDPEKFWKNSKYMVVAVK